MAKNTKVIKKRITSVKNTRKITRSMQMIAAVKMQKAVKLSLQSKKYTEAIQELLQELSKVGSIEHALFEVRPVEREMLIIISSNRGLCGNFNVNVLNKAREYINQETNTAGKSILAVGKKAAGFARKRELDLLALYEHLGDNPSFDAILPIAKEAVTRFTAGEVDRVSVIYTDYKSSFYQVPQVLQLLPLSAVSENDNKSGEPTAEKDYKFEPNRQELLDYLVPRIVETQLYQAVLDSAASEHSSRMIAMKNATDSAGDIIQGLTLEFNKSRQAAITQEVAEIVGGVEALAGAQS